MPDYVLQSSSRNTLDSVFLILHYYYFRSWVKQNPRSTVLLLEKTTRITNFASACCAWSVLTLLHTLELSICLFYFLSLVFFHTVFFQAALEAPRVLNLNSNKNFSGPYGTMMCRIWLKLACISEDSVKEGTLAKCFL